MDDNLTGNIIKDSLDQLRGSTPLLSRIFGDASRKTLDTILSPRKQAVNLQRDFLDGIKKINDVDEHNDTGLSDVAYVGIIKGEIFFIDIWTRKLLAVPEDLLNKYKEDMEMLISQTGIQIPNKSWGINKSAEQAQKGIEEYHSSGGISQYAQKNKFFSSNQVNDLTERVTGVSTDELEQYAFTKIDDSGKYAEFINIDEPNQHYGENTLQISTELILIYNEMNEQHMNETGQPINNSAFHQQLYEAYGAAEYAVNNYAKPQVQLEKQIHEYDTPILM